MMRKISPRWHGTTKRLAIVTLMIGFAWLLIAVRRLILPIFMSLVVAYVLWPAVQFLHKRLRLPRALSLAVVYLFVIFLLIAIPARVTSPLLRQLNAFISNMPFYVEQIIFLSQEPITLIGGQTFILADVVPLERALEYIVNYVPSVGLQSVNIFGSVASATVSTLGWILFVLFVSFYMIKDHEKLFRGMISMVPAEYEWEMYQLGYELNAVWNAFLRGQLILFLIMGTITFTVASIIGLPNPLLLGLIAGMAEFLPQIGPFFGMVPGVLIAFFQSQQSWLGSMMSPVGFAMLVLGLYILFHQFEGYFLVPRVLGHSLNIHPMIVFVAALAGAGLAGVFGILLASPLLASGRVVVRYVYCKLQDIPPYGDPEAAAPAVEESEHSRGKRRLKLLGRRLPFRSAGSPTKTGD